MESRIISERACTHVVKDRLSTCLLTTKVMIKTCKIIIVRALLCECETRFVTLREEHKLRASENRALRGIFRPKRDSEIDVKSCHVMCILPVYMLPYVVPAYCAIQCVLYQRVVPYNVLYQRLVPKCCTSVSRHTMSCTCVLCHIMCCTSVLYQSVVPVCQCVVPCVVPLCCVAVCCTMYQSTASWGRNSVKFLPPTRRWRPPRSCAGFNISLGVLCKQTRCCDIRIFQSREIIAHAPPYC
jgi:hypothetical protein